MHTLSLKYCPHVNDEVCIAIAEHANPYYLRELYLDGCDKINDTALQRLAAPRRQVANLHRIHPEQQIKLF